MSLSERSILQTLSTLLPRPDVLEDDAFYDPETREIFTTDLLIEDHHFSMAYCSPEDIGWKAAAVNLSDIAAMGGEPRYLLISLGLPSSASITFVEGFYSGVQQLLRQAGGQVVGGDTVSAPCVVVNITAVGYLPPGSALGCRNQAHPGDLIITTGPAGLSCVGLSALQSGQSEYPQCQLAHKRPIPRLEAGKLLARTYERYALMDSSDGLADAVLQMAMKRGVHFVLEQEKLPLHPELLAFSQATASAPWSTVLYGGEDFELVATVPEWNPALEGYFTAIGRVEATAPTGATLRAPDGRIVEELSFEKTYQHFSGQHFAGAPFHDT
jgi:thiamine-monophosphate kinase